MLFVFEWVSENSTRPTVPQVSYTDGLMIMSAGTIWMTTYGRPLNRILMATGRQQLLYIWRCVYGTSGKKWPAVVWFRCNCPQYGRFLAHRYQGYRFDVVKFHLIYTVE